MQVEIHPGDLSAPQEHTASAVIIRNRRGQPVAVAREEGDTTVFWTAGDPQFADILRAYGVKALPVSLRRRK